MKEISEIYQWFSGLNQAIHVSHPVASLPNPIFNFADGRQLVSFSSNNYLGLSNHPNLAQAASKCFTKYGVANCESPLLGGDIDLLEELENKLAFYAKRQGAITFATGYLTNIAALSYLAMPSFIPRFYGFRPSQKYSSQFFSDEFNHMSLKVGMGFSRNEIVTYPHCDMNYLETQLKNSHKNNKIIVSDGVFSMDGDIAPLPDLLALADNFDAYVYIDDAHGTGIFGKQGCGIAEHFGVSEHPRLIYMSTLSKAHGVIGGFVAADQAIIETFKLCSSIYAFTSTIAPAHIAALLESLKLVHDDSDLRDTLWNNQRHFVQKATDAGLDLMSTQSCILPIKIGNEQRCMAIAEKLIEHGFYVDAVVFPSVPLNQSRLRININATHIYDQIDNFTNVLKNIIYSNARTN